MTKQSVRPLGLTLCLVFVCDELTLCVCDELTLSRLLSYQTDESVWIYFRFSLY